MFRHYYIKLLELGTDYALKNKFKILWGLVSRLVPLETHMDLYDG